MQKQTGRFILDFFCLFLNVYDLIEKSIEKAEFYAKSCLTEMKNRVPERQ